MIEGELLDYIQTRLEEAQEAPNSPYKDGVVVELEELREYVVELMYLNGVDE